MPPASIVDPGPSLPDESDWTWVLTRPCPDCGFDPDDIGADGVPAILWDAAGRFVAVLERADVATRPAAGVWSPLEYACHVRDVLKIFLVRVDLMLTADDPVFANWDQDATAVDDDYAGQDPAQVATDLAAAAAAIANRFDTLHDDEWDRTGNRSDGSRFTVDSLSRYLIHDPVHHLYDVTGRPAR